METKQLRYYKESPYWDKTKTWSWDVSRQLPELFEGERAFHNPYEQLMNM